jgi:tetratricopeptide (TPR) repeat protein
LAFDYIRAGLKQEAADILRAGGESPMIFYMLAVVNSSSKAYRQARLARPDYCFPNRLEEMLVLEQAMSANPEDPKTPYYLGNLLYARLRHADAIANWERSVRLDPSFAIPCRNLGIAYFNVLGKKGKALSAFDRVVALNPHDARLLYERDQLAKRLGHSPQRRLAELEKKPCLVRLRDDLSVELASLYNQTGHHLKAKVLFESRRFGPWEGGEGSVLREYVRTHLALARRALAAGDRATARRLLEAALAPPQSLGEACHPLANQSDLHYWFGVACEPEPCARQWFEHAAASRGDFQQMSVRSFSEMTYYNALSLKKLGRVQKCRSILRDLLDYALRLRRETPKVDYFATSLPAMLLFRDDLALRNRTASEFLEAQARLGLGQKQRARTLLQKTLNLDRNHAMAADLLREVEP